MGFLFLKKHTLHAISVTGKCWAKTGVQQSRVLF